MSVLQRFYDRHEKECSLLIAAILFFLCGYASITFANEQCQKPVNNIMITAKEARDLANTNRTDERVLAAVIEDIDDAIDLEARNHRYWYTYKNELNADLTKLKEHYESKGFHVRINGERSFSRTWDIEIDWLENEK